MKRKIVTAFMMAALGSSLVFSQAAMAADTTAKTETSEDADKDSTAEDKDAADDTKDADKADENKDEVLKTIGEEAGRGYGRSTFCKTEKIQQAK